MLSIEEIGQFITEDDRSDKKKKAREGQRYYDGDHDIKDYRLFYFDVNGKLVEDKTRSNIKIPHPFFTELVDQEVQYMLSNDGPIICSDDEELQKKLDEYFGDEFREQLQDCLAGCVAKGFEQMYAYKSDSGVTKFVTADSLGVVEVRGKDTDDGCKYVIYHYIDRVDKGRTRIKRIQVWDDKQTYYYVKGKDGKIVLDDSVRLNPRPHITYKKEGDDALYYEGNGGYGFIPFFRLDNNRKQISGLKPVKALIDDYDLMACGLSNNIQDASEYLVVVKGFQGGDLDELVQNVRVKKHIGVDGDDGGDVDYRTVDIPYQARQIKMEADEKNIYRFGMGFNSAQLGDGNITNIVIKSRYALLDLKCDKLEGRLKAFLRKLIKVALDEINKESGTDYQQKNVYFDFTRVVMTNALDNVQVELTEAQKKQVQINIFLQLQNIFDDETIIKAMCEVLDIDYDDIKDKLPEDPQVDVKKAQEDLEVVQTEEGTSQKAEEAIGKPLNGAQTSSMLSIIQQYKQGQLTPEEAISVLSISLGVSEEKARKVLRIA